VLIGPYLHSAQVSELSHCKSAAGHDSLNFGIECTNKLLNFEEVVVKHKTDIQRLKEDTGGSALLVITNATLLTMHTNTPDDIIRDGVMFVRDGVIEAIYGSEEDVVIPQSAAVIDAQGGFVVPGTCRRS
jgi:hypothetical protein